VALIIIFNLVGTLFSNLPNIISECISHGFIVFLSGLCIRDKKSIGSWHCPVFWSQQPRCFDPNVRLDGLVSQSGHARIAPPGDKGAKDPNKYLITNDVNLTVPNIICYYRNRWTIEVMFRDCKQHLVLGKCQSHQSADSQLRHTTMVFLAFTLLELMESTGQNGSTIDTIIGDIRRYLQHQQLIYVNAQYYLVDISQSPTNRDHVNEFSDLLILRILHPQRRN
jgi:hypothetical protein